jgi:NADH:ubiquinone oxidoreductase subunit K
MVWKLIIIGLFTSGFIALYNLGGRNLIILILAIELLFFALSLTCLVIFYSKLGYNWNYDLIFMATAVTVLAAAESAIALALISLLHKKTRSIKVRRFSS